ncbi:MAG TPA: FAD-binding oxidoreductase [Gaiellales bacterium]|nr:FAD-binding oxidoreductase [Gaiellales bacterium]
MRDTLSNHISTLRAALNGKVIGADDPRYDDVRRVFFTGFDRRPAAIVRVTDAADVARVVGLARETGAELAVRSGGHSRAGHGTSDGGIVIDLSAMNAVEVDPDDRTAWAQTGVTAGGYTARTSAHGLTTGLGDTASVGLGGITLGGGIGYLVRKTGLTIDDVLAAEVVTADGELLRADEQSHPELFWALRGGGGNFGVVTRLKLRLHAVDQVIGGMLLLPASPGVITGLVAAADAADEDLSLIANVLKAPPLPFIPAEQHGKPMVMIQMVYAGDAEAGAKAMAPIRALATPLADMVRPIRYPEMYAGAEGPAPAYAAGTNMLVDELSTEAAETILAHLETATAAIAAVQVRVLGGAMARVADDATAFGHRGARLMVNIAAMDPRAETGPEHDAWAAELATALADGAPERAYLGFVGDEGQDGVRRAYPPATLERLARTKRRYDPDNLFHLNLNVVPHAAR